jgi:hypothetical protein
LFDRQPYKKGQRKRARGTGNTTRKNSVFSQKIGSHGKHEEQHESGILDQSCGKAVQRGEDQQAKPEAEIEA